MKKMMMVAGLAALLVGCKDDEKSKSNTELLTAENWLTTSVTIRTVGPTSDTTIDITPEDACELDNIVKFNLDYTYSSEEGATKCDTNDNQIIESGSWSFKNDEKTLEIISGTDTQTMNINVLNASTLEVGFSDTNLNYISTYSATFKH